MLTKRGDIVNEFGERSCLFVIGGELERLASPGLDPVVVPGSRHRRVTNVQLAGQQPGRPVRHAQAWGGGSRVEARIAASSMVLGQPERGASSRPSSPAARNRSRHWVTVEREIPNRRETAEGPCPTAMARTTFTRTDEERAQLVSVKQSCSSSSTTPVDCVITHLRTAELCKGINDAQH